MSAVHPFHPESARRAPDRAKLVDYAPSGYDRSHTSSNGDLHDRYSQAQSFSRAAFRRSPCLSLPDRVCRARMPKPTCILPKARQNVFKSRRSSEPTAGRVVKLAEIDHPHIANRINAVMPRKLSLNPSPGKSAPRLRAFESLLCQRKQTASQSAAVALFVVHVISSIIDLADNDGYGQPKRQQRRFV